MNISSRIDTETIKKVHSLNIAIVEKMIKMTDPNDKKTILIKT